MVYAKNLFKIMSQRSVKIPTKQMGESFGKPLKPLVSDKCKSGTQKITLMENNEIVNSPSDVSNILNEYYKNVANDIGTKDYINDEDTFDDIVEPHELNDSVQFIRSKIDSVNEFSFKCVSATDILKMLKKLNCRKATGCDSIPPKLLKIGAEQLYIPITFLVKKCLVMGKFPDELKSAEVAPIFKKE